MAIDRRKFEAKVDRSGEHHLWRGATSAAGVGQIRVDGKLQTAPRVAWELAHGPLPAGARVERCPDSAACVRVEHLSVAGIPTVPQPSAAKSRREAGSMRQTAPGKWELSVTAGRYDDGTLRRVFRSVEASSDRAAAVALASFVTEVKATPLAVRRSRTG